MALLDASGRLLPPAVCRSFDAVVTLTAAADLVLVDIPIGLRSGDGGAKRACDRAARRLLGPRHSSVFRVPVRAAVHAGSYEEACAINRTATGRSLSRQSWGIAPRIAAVDRMMRENPALQERVRESHPEVCLTGLNGWSPMKAKKRSEEGLQERLAVLERYEPGVRAVLAEALGRLKRADAAPDDIVDAMALAVAARMAWESGIPTLPAEPERDEAGLRMEMVVPTAPPKGGI